MRKKMKKTLGMMNWSRRRNDVELGALGDRLDDHAVHGTATVMSRNQNAGPELRLSKSQNTVSVLCCCFIQQ